MMNTSLRKTVSAFALGALFFTSLVGVCTMMITTACVGDCSVHDMTMMDGGMAATAIDCLKAGPTCGAVADHMTTFAESFPSVMAKTLTLLLSAAALAFVWISVRKKDPVGGLLKVKLKHLTRRRSEPIVPEHLVFAFSKGILHSEIYA